MRLAQGRSETGQGTGREKAAVAAAGPFLLGPVLLYICLGGTGRVADRLLEVGQHCGLAGGRAHPAGQPGLLALDETEQHSGRAVMGRVVVHQLDRALIRVDVSGEPFLPPERGVVDRLDLDRVALREALDQLGPVGREDRVIIDEGTDRRRHCHDHLPGPPGALVAGHVTEALLLADLPDRRVELNPGAELFRHPDRKLLRAAHESRILGTLGGRGQPDETARGGLVAGRGNVEEEVEQGDVPRLAGPDRIGGEVGQKARALAGGVGEFESLEGLAVIQVGVGVLPRFGTRDSGPHVLQLEH